MIPCAAISHRILTGIEFRPARLTHRLGEIRAIEHEAIGRKPVDVRGHRVHPTIDRQVTESAIIRKDDEDVGRVRGKWEGGND